jgi:hypothetical protein
MADKFELPPFVPTEPLPQPVTVPDFPAALKEKSARAKFLADDCGLIGKGQLPELEIALRLPHQPNDHVQKEILGVGKLDLVYDDHGQLASAQLNYGHGQVEIADFRNGQIVSDHTGGPLDATYVFDDKGNIVSESEIDQTGTQRYFELAADGSLKRSVDTYPDKVGIELDNAPGNHLVRDWIPGGAEGTLRYDEKLRFQSGQIKSPDGLWGIRIGPDGKAILVKEREA